MLEHFRRALARVQSDYGFYIDCQTNPAAALAGYDLSPGERSALSDPGVLATVLTEGVGTGRLAAIKVTISGKHDWVNRAAPSDAPGDQADRDAMIAVEVEAIRRASTDDERTEAAVRLMELIG
jgi:hypothetical protein